MRGKRPEGRGRGREGFLRFFWWCFDLRKKRGCCVVYGKPFETKLVILCYIKFDTLIYRHR